MKKGESYTIYTSAAGLQGICGGEFWVTERFFLNDIMEFQVATQIFCEVLDKHMANKVCAEKLKKKVCDEIDRLNRPGMLGEEVAYSGDYVISFRIKNEVLTPFIKKKISNLNSLKSIMIGPKNKSDIAEKGLWYFFRNMKLDVKVYKSKMPIRY